MERMSRAATPPSAATTIAVTLSSSSRRVSFHLLFRLLEFLPQQSYEKGNISRHVATLKIGDTIRVKGPKGNFTYSPGLANHISMIAGGTGITPMIQIIRAILKNSSDKTTVSLIYANVNEEDILLRDELKQLLDAHSAKFKVFYVLNNPPAVWNGGVGFVSKDHISNHFPSSNTPNTKVLLCGPPPMISAMKWVTYSGYRAPFYICSYPIRKHLEELKFPRGGSKLVDQVCPFINNKAHLLTLGYSTQVFVF